MRESLRAKATAIRDRRIAAKGEAPGRCFHAFFADRSVDPERPMEAAAWRIRSRRLDHFETAATIRAPLASGA